VEDQRVHGYGGSKLKLRIVPYKMASRSARLLQQKLSDLLGYKVYRGQPKAGRTNIPWGLPDEVGADKLRAFTAFGGHGVSCPEHTTDRGVATNWLARTAIVARKLLRASRGKGAVYIERGGECIDAPLYVKYILKKKEFRVHVYADQVLLVQEKRRRRGTKPDSKIRSHDRDWVFCTQNLVYGPALLDVALDACRAVGHSGAVDIVYNERQDKYFVLEVNSAPGLSPSTAEKYAQRMIELWG
jgi:hypothetical protein